MHAFGNAIPLAGTLDWTWQAPLLIAGSTLAALTLTRLLALGLADRHVAAPRLTAEPKCERPRPTRCRDAPSRLRFGADLNWWSDRLREWDDAGPGVFVYFNNDGYANPVHNATRFGDSLAAEPITADTAPASLAHLSL